MYQATSGNAGVTIDNDTNLLTTTKRGFPSVVLAGVALQRGRWYYEATIVQPGIGQIGWGDLVFVGASSDGHGVGDDKHSWAYDGRRVLVWYKGSRPWGSPWKAGDVVGAAVDVDARMLRFSLNGDWGPPMGTAFR